MKRIMILLFVTVACMGFAMLPPDSCVANEHTRAASDTYASSFVTARDTAKKASVTVYICTGPKSTCYHSRSTCKGLKSCSATVKSISLEDAKKMKRTPCKMCYK